MDAIAEQLLARLRGNPRDRDAYDALKAHYVHARDLTALADLLESWAVSNPDDRQGSSDAWTEAADAVLQAGGDRTRAKTLYRRALELNVLHPRAGDRLRELLETDTDFQGLIEILEPYARALEASGGSPSYIAGLYQRLAEVWQHAFDRPDIAQNYRQRAAELRTKPSRPVAIPEEDPRTLAENCERQAAAELVPERKAALLSRLAQIRESQLQDLEGAIAALRQARAVTPSDVVIMHQLATTLLTYAGRTDPQSARLAHRRAGELFYQIAQAVDESAALPYLESALAAMPDHEGSLALLERVAHAQRRTDLLPGYWVRFVAAAGDGPEADQRRVWLGRAYLRSDQFEDAVYCLQPAVEHHFDGADELLQEAYARLESSPPLAARPASPVPSALPAALPFASEGGAARPAGGIADLRKRVRAALAARRGDEAVEYCRSILALDPSDGEAFNLLESQLRRRGDYPALKELLLGTTRSAALPSETRRLRLREVAQLAESKLRDTAAALEAWREVSVLDASDQDAAAQLKRLLHKTQGWDELAAVLERESLATTLPLEKRALLRELAELHRDRRKDASRAAEALHRLHALCPDDAELRAELCELLIALEQYGDAVPLLRECIAHSHEELDELKYSHTLAAILHEKLHALDEAYRLCAQILELRPADKAAFERMERIDEQSDNPARLLSTLERRSLLAAKADRPALLIRMADVAERRLLDLDKAAAYLSEAMDLAPEDQAPLERLVEMWQAAGQFDRLVEILNERSSLSAHPKMRATILRRMAATQREHLHDDDAAAESYRRLLQFEEDEEALRFLRGFAARRGDAQELCDVLQRLATRVPDAIERRDLLFERAQLLHERLGFLTEAAATLKHILERLDPAFEPAIELLSTLSVRNRDLDGLALALERRLALSDDASLRLLLCRRLADLYENELADGARAIATLENWTREDPVDPEPYRRMRALLLAREKWSGLLVVLDALREREDSPQARDEAAIEAARVASEHLQDVQGAWRRLVPLIEERNQDAASALHQMAGRTGRQAELAALYVQLAQKSSEASLQADYWRTAAQLFERDLHDPGQAFEASLRMLATELGNRDFLADVDRLALATKAYRRLAQVYDRLLKHQEQEGPQLELLTRLADLLEHDQPEEALDRILSACRLAPLDDALLARAEALAQRARRGDELLPLYDRRSDVSNNDGDRVRVMLRAARLCDGALRDREQAIAYLRKALAMAGASLPLTSEVEAAAREFDWARPELGKDHARRALIRMHRETAQHADPEIAERLLLRGAQLLQSELDDERSAFDLLLQGLGLLPRSEPIYAALRSMADTRGRLDAIDSQLARLVEDATDLTTSIAVLRRRGSLLEEGLGRFHDAATVYARLLQQNPDDTLASERLRINLRRSGRYQELLVALDRQLHRSADSATRVALLKEVASTWETDLRNRWEALDAWRSVLAESPDDRDATASLRRLERAHLAPPERAETGRREVAERREPEDVPIAAAFPEPSKVTAPRFREVPGEGPASPEARPNEAALAFAKLRRSSQPKLPTPPTPPSEQGEAQADDLAALDAVVSARRGRIEELDAFDDTETMADLDVRETLPLPPVAPRNRPSSPDRLSPPPPPPRRAGNSASAEGATKPMPPIAQPSGASDAARRPPPPPSPAGAGTVPPPADPARGGGVPKVPSPSGAGTVPPPPPRPGRGRPRRISE